MEHFRFNRHEIMNAKEVNMLVKILGEKMDFELKNMLYGLFDGYYYFEAETMWEETELAADPFKDFFMQSLFNKIKKETFTFQ